jgi:hypothetical protein
MPKIDFGVPARDKKHTVLPEGRYVVRVDDVGEQLTKRGNPIWKIRFVVTTGPYARTRIFDRVVFSEAARERLAILCRAFGIEPSGVIDLSPEKIIGRECSLAVQLREYAGADGLYQAANEVPYDGYRKAVREHEEEIPF